MPITVLLADDHKLVLEGLQALLHNQLDLCVVGAVDSGERAVEEAERLRPDVVVIDVQMPGFGGIEATRRIRKACRSTQVVVLSLFDDAGHADDALRAGALAYLLKDHAPVELPAAIRAVHWGQRYVSAGIRAGPPENGANT